MNEHAKRHIAEFRDPFLPCNRLLVAQLGGGRSRGACLIVYLPAVGTMLSVLEESLVNLKFLVKLAKSATKSHTLLKPVHGYEFSSRTQVLERCVLCHP